MERRIIMLRIEPHQLPGLEGAMDLGLPDEFADKYRDWSCVSHATSFNIGGVLFVTIVYERAA